MSRQALVLMATVSAILASCARSPDEGALRRRADAYLNASLRNDPHSIWMIMSPNLRNNYSEEKFMDYYKQQNLKIHKYKIVGVDASNQHGAVFADVTYIDRDGNIAGERQKLKFTSINGNWYYVDFESVNHAAAPESK